MTDDFGDSYIHTPPPRYHLEKVVRVTFDDLIENRPLRCYKCGGETRLDDEAAKMRGVVLHCACGGITRFVWEWRP